MDPVARLGAPAPGFELPDINGKVHRLPDRPGRIVVLNFWSVECPWSARADPQVMAAVQGSTTDLWTIACCSGESLEDIRRVAQERGLKTVLLDPNQAVADLYQASATPHIFLIDTDGVLRYRGAPDDTGFGSRPATRSYLEQALTALKAGRWPDPAETPALGCAIVRRLG
ncbi:MAG TPA: redoxin domain-containing protein [Anaerolineales bacterium]|nr:redoxin domain-containing protein [Anaerolineales bacterium]